MQREWEWQIWATSIVFSLRRDTVAIAHGVATKTMRKLILRDWVYGLETDRSAYLFHYRDIILSVLYTGRWISILCHPLWNILC